MASSARIEELEKKFNENPRRYFAPLANEYRKAGETEQAIALCRAYLPQQPGHMSGHIVFGQALFDAGQLDEAQSVFGTALGLDPENLIALRHLGDIALSRGDTAGARGWYQRVLDADPRNEEIAAQLASLDKESGGAATGASTASSEQDASLGWGEINPEQSGSKDVPSGTATDDLLIERASAGADVEIGASAGPAAIGEHTRTPSKPAGSDETSEPEAEVSGPASISGSVTLEAGSAGAAADTAEMAASPDPATAAQEEQGAAPKSATPGEGSDTPQGSDAADSTQAIGAEAAEAGAPVTPSANSDDGIDVDELFASVAPTESQPPTNAASGSGTTQPPAPADDDTADAAPTSDSDIGLELMEFVPPSSPGTGQRALGFETGHEAVVGGPIDQGDDAPRGSGTPAAFVTETMAELYLQQGFVQEALSVYRQLLAQNPEDEGLRERVAHLEQGDRSSVSMAAVSDEVVEAARRRQTSPNRRSMRQFLGALASRRAPQRSGEQPAVDAGAQPPVDDLALGSEPAGEPGFDLDAPAEESAPQPWAMMESGASPVDTSAAAAGEPDAGTAGSSDAGAGDWELPRSGSSPGGTQRWDTTAGPADGSRATSRPSGGEQTLDELFDHPAPNAADHAAATALSGAFDAASVPAAPAPPRGRPTRAAIGELSLDNVFRESGGDAGLGRPRSDFSFDQFFSEDAESSSSTTPEESPQADAQDEAPSGDDIGQFNNWLEGLKKK